MWLIHGVEFPKLGISIESLPEAFQLFGGFEIALYGILFGAAILIGFWVTQWQAVRTGQDKEIYLDFALYAVMIALLGARIYYVIFSWEEFAADPMKILRVQTDGLGFYGGLLAAILTAMIYARVKKLSFGQLVDTGCMGLLAGQIIGRWGDLFARQALGGYTNNMFAMRVHILDVDISFLTEEMVLNAQQGGYLDYVQMHPVFLYEILWNLALFWCLIAYTRHKKFQGELFMIYLVVYAMGRFWMEGLRTDVLYLWGTSMPVAQLLAVISMTAGITGWIGVRIRSGRYKI